MEVDRLSPSLVYTCIISIIDRPFHEEPRSVQFSLSYPRRLLLFHYSEENTEHIQTLVLEDPRLFPVDLFASNFHCIQTQQEPIASCTC